MKKRFQWIFVVIMTMFIATVHCHATEVKNLKEIDYLDKYEVIHQNMMEKIKYTEKTGDLNIDFLFYILPYEQFGVEISKSELRYGSNQKIKDVVNIVVKTSKDHIKAIEKLLKSMEKDPVIDETKETAYLEQFNQLYNEMIISLKIDRENVPGTVDKDYLDKMVVYLDYEQKFANLILANTNHEEIIKLAQKIITDEENNLGKLNTLLEIMK